jgi:hypothetical protein
MTPIENQHGTPPEISRRLSLRPQFARSEFEVTRKGPRENRAKSPTFSPLAALRDLFALPNLAERRAFRDIHEEYGYAGDLLVEPRGIEPLTSSLRTTRSPN